MKMFNFRTLRRIHIGWYLALCALCGWYVYIFLPAHPGLLTEYAGFPITPPYQSDATPVKTEEVQVQRIFTFPDGHKETVEGVDVMRWDTTGIFGILAGVDRIDTTCHVGGNMVRPGLPFYVQHLTLDVTEGRWLSWPYDEMGTRLKQAKLGAVKLIDRRGLKPDATTTVYVTEDDHLNVAGREFYRPKGRKLSEMWVKFDHRMVIKVLDPQTNQMTRDTGYVPNLYLWVDGQVRKMRTPK
jgi:hypothetical protein